MLQKEHLKVFVIKIQYVIDKDMHNIDSVKSNNSINRFPKRTDGQSRHFCNGSTDFNFLRVNLLCSTRPLKQGVTQ